MGLYEAYILTYDIEKSYVAYVAFEGYICCCHVHGSNMMVIVSSMTPLHFHVEMVVKRYYMTFGATISTCISAIDSAMGVM